MWEVGRGMTASKFQSRNRKAHTETGGGVRCAQSLWVLVLALFFPSCRSMSADTVPFTAQTRLLGVTTSYGSRPPRG